MPDPIYPATRVAAAAEGGFTPGHIVSAASNNAASIKATAGTLGFFFGMNLNAAARYVKFYDKASAPDPSVDTPKLTFMLPGNTAGSGVASSFPPQGVEFVNGIGIAIVTGIADNNNTAVAASEIVANYGFK